MKAKKFVSKVVAMLLCVIIIGGFAPGIVYARDQWLAIEVRFDSALGNLVPLQAIDIHLYYRGQRAEPGTRMASMIDFEPDFTTADIDHLEMRITDGNGWTADRLIVPLRDFTNYGNGVLRYTWEVFQVGTTPPPDNELPVQPPVSATRTLRFAIGNTTFTDNGSPLVLEAAPFLEDGRTHVPLRVIVEAFGSDDIAFNDGVITFTVKGQPFSMTVGQELPGGMGTPVIREGRTFVPVRFIVESVGAEVRWDSAAQAVYVYID